MGLKVVKSKALGQMFFLSRNKLKWAVLNVATNI